MKLFLTISLLLVFIAACKYEPGSKEVKINDKYAIVIPNYLSKTDRLAPDVPIQYQNKFRSFYLICTGEKKENDKNLDTFSKEVIKGFTDQIAGINVKNIEGKNEVNGFPAQYHELAGTVTNKGIFYLLVTLETPTHFYQICAWTLQSKKEQHEQAFYDIVGSFRKI